MKAAVVTRFGTPEVLVTIEAPDPVAGPGQVVIDVEAADVLWVETMIRHSGGGEYFDVTPPYVPGNGVAGRVRAVGDGVDPGWIGREVVAHTGERGGYAEPGRRPRGPAVSRAGRAGPARGGGAAARRGHRPRALRGHADRQWRQGARGGREQARAALGGEGADVILDNKAADAHAAIEERRVFGKTLLLTR